MIEIAFSGSAFARILVSTTAQATRMLIDYLIQNENLNIWNLASLVNVGTHLDPIDT